MLAARYVALNPVRARLVQRPQDWAWSSLRAHLEGCDDGLVTVAPPFDRLGSVTALIDTELIGIEPEAVAPARVRSAETIGRPLGSKTSCDAVCDFRSRNEKMVRAMVCALQEWTGNRWKRAICKVSPQLKTAVSALSLKCTMRPQLL